MNRFLKPLLIGLSGLAIVILLITSLLPREVMVSRGVNVGNMGKDSIIDYLSRLDHWKDWNLLVKDAPDLHFSPGDSLTGIGSSLVWKNASGTSNRIELKNRNEKGLLTEMTINNERPLNSGFSVEKRKADSVQLVWYIIENLKWYPWEKFYGIMLDKLRGPTMQESLKELKKELEDHS